MSAQLQVVKKLAAKAQAANMFELQSVLTALVAAMIDWMEQQEEKNDGTR